MSNSLKTKKARKISTSKTEYRETMVLVPKSKKDMSCNWKSLSSKLNYVPKRKEVIVSHLSKSHKKSKCGKFSTNFQRSECDVWFDDVDPILLQTTTALTTDQLHNGTDKILAVDCEMVGVGECGKESALGRVSVVDQHGECIYDKYVKPGEEVTDFRTEFSGIHPHHLTRAEDLGTVCHEVTNLLRGKILVGHDLRNDLQALLIKHPKSMIRDTSKYKIFRALVNGSTPSLKKLSQQFLGMEIQTGEHDSDAQAAMRLYLMFRTQWEADLKMKRNQWKFRHATRKSVVTPNIP